ncbi:T6SS immunity protein Tdi1 domain-containing protein [Kocuria sp. CPCC 104605]|uniref:DUF1851 domain-containing protein n=2 Tax=Micrococcaceae TaxID=1268 RepID=A0A846TMV1_9MICC|nr:T6SS immunity protein Tdi1 domain-containing protein [Kocuria sp. CPCC 104605]NKE10538.1 DUF1851 domain-containing protein [Kocuria subflava]
MKLKPSAKLPNTTAWATETIGTTLADEDWCGASLNRGLLRVHNDETGAEATSQLHDAFGEGSTDLVVFATDWQAIHYAAGVLEDGTTVVVAGDIASASLEVIAPLDEFLTFVTTDRKAEQYFDRDDFNRFRLKNRLLGLQFNECASYKTPPMLGGQNTIENRDLTDLEVHWGLFGQIFQQVKDKEDGTPVTEITTD